MIPDTEKRRLTRRRATAKSSGATGGRFAGALKSRNTAPVGLVRDDAGSGAAQQGGSMGRQQPY